MSEAGRKRGSLAQATVFIPGIGTSTQAKATRALVNYLPLQRDDIEYASQSTLLRLAVNYVKIKSIAENLDAKGGWSPTMDPISAFSGFILVLDSSTNIMYASGNITRQIGPALVDTIGEPFGSLVHEDDHKKLEEVAKMLITNQRKQYTFAVQMKTTMSPTVRSQGKRTYKKVLISAHFKSISDSCDPKNMVVLMFCRSEDFIGIPEIVVGAHLRDTLDPLVWTFRTKDPKSVWIVGWKDDQVLGKPPALFAHPENETVSVDDLAVFQECIKTGTPCVWPPPRKNKSPLIRVLSSWGQWLWQFSILTPKLSSSGKLKHIVMDMYFCGVDESSTAVPPNPLEASVQDPSIAAPPQPSVKLQAETSMTEVMNLAQQVVEQTNLEPSVYHDINTSSSGSIHPMPPNSTSHLRRADNALYPELGLPPSVPPLTSGNPKTVFTIADKPPNELDFYHASIPNPSTSVGLMPEYQTTATGHASSHHHWQQPSRTQAYTEPHVYPAADVEQPRDRLIMPIQNPTYFSINAHEHPAPMSYCSSGSLQSYTTSSPPMLSNSPSLPDSSPRSMDSPGYPSFSPPCPMTLPPHSLNSPYQASSPCQAESPPCHPVAAQYPNLCPVTSLPTPSYLTASHTHASESSTDPIQEILANF